MSLPYPTKLDFRGDMMDGFTGRTIASQSVTTGPVNNFPDRGTITSRQRPILRMIAFGKTQKEIANELGIADSAVGSRIRDVRLKFPGIEPIHLPLLAYREGVVTLEELMKLLPPFRGTRDRRKEYYARTGKG